MKEYSFTEARQHFASILDEARKEGVVCVKKRDGELQKWLHFLTVFTVPPRNVTGIKKPLKLVAIRVFGLSRTAPNYSVVRVSITKSTFNGIQSLK
jgi:hypothetical protein